MSCINQMMQHQQIRGCQWGFSDKEHGARCSGWVTSRPDLLYRPILSVSYRLSHFLLAAIRGRTLRAVLWGEDVSCHPGNRRNCLQELQENQTRTVRLCWQGKPEQFLQHSQICLFDLSGNHGLQATPDCTNNHIHAHSDIHILSNKPDKWKGQRYHGIQMRTFKLEMQPEVVRTATWHCLQQVALNRNITTFIYKFLLFIFFLSSRNRSDTPCICKNSYWLYFVGSVDYICLICHVSYHLLNTQGSASGLLTAAANTDTAKGPIFSPGATGASGTVPALISAHTGHYLLCQNVQRHLTCPWTVHLSAHRGEAWNQSL